MASDITADIYKTITIIIKCIQITIKAIQIYNSTACF